MAFSGEIRYTLTGMRVYPYTFHQCYLLENMTSVRDFTFKRNVRKPITGFLIPDDPTNDTKFGTFISYHHDSLVLQSLFENYVVRKEEASDYRQLNYNFGLNADVSPREAQMQIINQIIEYEDSHQWFVYLSQGLGKTLLSVYIISYFNMRTLVMCYNKRVLKQWVETFREKTTMNMKSVLFIEESVIFDRILEGRFPVWDYDIFMCTPKLLTMYGARKGYEVLHMLMTKMGIGLKIFDEAHRNIKNIVKINAYTSINKTLYLSGDFAQANKKQETLYYNMFHGIPVLRPTMELMNTLKFTVAVVVTYNTKPSNQEMSEIYPRRGFNFFNYMKYQITKRKFFSTLWFIMDSINKANENNYRILILLNMIEHVNILADKIEDKYPNKYIIGRYHSEIDEREKMEAKENADLIVSTHSSFGVGIDTERIKYVISCSIGTKIDDNQASGRARPLEDHSDVYYFMMIDMGFKYCQKTLKSRLNYLDETKIKSIKKIDL